MDHVKNILPGALQDRGLFKDAWASLVVHRARQWVQETLPMMSRDILVTTWKDHELYVTCQNAIAAQEIHNHQTDLKAHMNEKVELVRAVHITRA